MNSRKLCLYCRMMYDVYYMLHPEIQKCEHWDLDLFGEKKEFKK